LGGFQQPYPELRRNNKGEEEKASGIIWALENQKLQALKGAPVIVREKIQGGRKREKKKERTRTELKPFLSLLTRKGRGG